MIPTKQELTLWQDTIDEFIGYSVAPEDYTGAQTQSIFLDIADIYSNIFRSISASLPEKGKWNPVRSSPLVSRVGFYVEYVSEKYENIVSFGTDEQGYYLQSWLRNAGNITRMPDEFWEKFLELRKIGILGFEESAVPMNGEEEYPQLHDGVSSHLFRLLRNFVLLEALEGTGEGIGMLTLHWSFHTPLEVLLEKGSNAFNRLYELNRMLQNRK